MEKVETENHQKILIVDFGSQTTHLIGRRFRQLGITALYADPKEALSDMEVIKPAGLVLSGGPASVYDSDAPKVSREILETGVPTLGICYGWQLMAQLLGGEVRKSSGEYGPETLMVTHQNTLLNLPQTEFQVYVSHGDSVTSLPEGFSAIAKTEVVDNAAALNPHKGLYGVQFHPEVSHTQNGLTILRNFAEGICHLPIKPLEFNPQTIVDKIRETVNDKKVICAVSGGVDSTVAAFLIGKAVEENLIPVYVDSGLMREGTEAQVEYIFSQLVRADLKVVEAKERFLQALKGITDPELKRKTIGGLYIDIFGEEAQKYQDVEFLGQGTIRSDVIESKGSKHASNIKSHHNVGGLPADLGFKLIEPLRDFYKDEVRELGRKMGLPEEVLMQQPFPGPGYAVRIRGEVTEKRLAQVKIADQIVLEEMKKAGFYEKVFQCFAVMTGAYSTAVKGDARAFAEVVAVRAYESDDVMTSDWADIPRPVLRRMSSRIVSDVPEVSRVVYDITTKPPATMEWE